MRSDAAPAAGPIVATTAVRERKTERETQQSDVAGAVVG